MPFTHSPELGVGVPTVPPSLMAVVPPQPGTEVALMGGVTSLSPFPLRGTAGWGGGHQQRGGHRPWWVAFPPLRQQLKIPPCAGAGLGHSSGRSVGTQPGTHPNASLAPTRNRPAAPGATGTGRNTRGLGGERTQGCDSPWHPHSWVLLLGWGSLYDGAPSLAGGGVRRGGWGHQALCCYPMGTSPAGAEGTSPPLQCLRGGLVTERESLFRGAVPHLRGGAHLGGGDAPFWGYSVFFWGVQCLTKGGDSPCWGCSTHPGEGDARPGGGDACRGVQCPAGG